MLITLNNGVKNIAVTLVFAFKNPKTNQHSLNISYKEDGKPKNIIINCREDEIGNLVLGIREGNITDLRGYFAYETTE